MKARLVYEILNLPHPWNEEKRESGVKCWCLCKTFKTDTPADYMTSMPEPVAIFNFDSEANLFERFVWSGASIELSRQTKDLFDEEKEYESNRK